MWEAKESTGQGALRGSQCRVAWLQTSSPLLPTPKDMVGFLAKQEQKSEDSEDREMKTVLWAEEAVPPGQLTSGQPSL